MGNKLEKTIDGFYKSLGKSIAERKNIKQLKRYEILADPKRVTDIVNGHHNIHYPNLIAKGEYEELYRLFLEGDCNSLKKNNEMEKKESKKFQECPENYDKMLWEHIDWNNMFQSTISELSELDISTDLGKLFDNTLIDYIPYATIKYDELHPEYGRVYIFPEERGKERGNAIKRVHLEHGLALFKKTFLEKFTGKRLLKFDRRFAEFVKDYLQLKQPNTYSLGLQAYNLQKNISGFAVEWQSLEEVQVSDLHEEKSDLQEFLEEYLENGREFIEKFKGFQQKYDFFNGDIK